MQIQTSGLFSPADDKKKQSKQPQQNAVQQGQENISMPNDPQIRMPDLGKASTKNPVEQAVDQQEQENALYGIPVSEQEWNIINNAASQSDNPEEELQRYAAAMTFSREYDLPISTTIQNLDELTEYQLGQKFKPTPTLFKSLQNSFKVAGITQDQTKLIEQWQDADRTGDEQRASQLAQQIDQMDQDLYALKDDTPRNLATTFTKAAIENVPFMLDVAGSGLKWGMGTYLAASAMLNLAGLAFTPVTGGASLAATAGVTAAAATQVGQVVGSVQRTKDIMGSRVYYELRKNGVDRDTAEVASQISGTLGGIVEVALDPLTGYLMGSTGGNTAISAITSKVMSKIIANGTLGAFIKGASTMGLSAVGEGTEEFIQSLTDGIASEIAYEVSDVIPPERSMSMIRQAVEEGVQGFGVGLITGGVLGSINVATGRSQTSIDMKQAAAIKQFASQVPSKETFVKTMESQKPESVKSADWSDAMSKIWEKNKTEGVQNPSSIETDESALNELDTKDAAKKPSGRIRRTESGELYTRESQNITTDTQGVEHHSMLVGDPLTGARYGYIDYALTGNSIEIEDVKVRDGYEGIRKEAITSLMRQYEGYDIQWEAKGENLQALRDEIIQSNPRGADAGLQYFDGVTDVDERLKLESMIGESMPNLNASEKSVAATILQLRAEAKGMSVDGYISTYGKDGNLFGNAQADGLELENVRGATSFENTAEGVRAIIYAGERGDFSTFTHEAFHVFRREMEQTPQLQQAFIDASQTDELKQFIDDHRQLFNDEMFKDMSTDEIVGTLSEFGETWTRTQEEAAARLWEGYLLDGKTSSPKLKNVFRRIAEWMSRVYEAMRGKVQLDQRIVDVFDSILDSDSPIAQAARNQQAQSGQPGMAAQYQGEQLYQAAPPKGPQYDKWFAGSKAVDEQGNPLTLYHGSGQPVINFDKAMQGQNTQAGSAKLGIFFTPNKYAAAQYADVAKPKAVLDMRNRLADLEKQMKSKSIAWSGTNADWDNQLVQDYWELSDQIDASEWDYETDPENAVMEANLVMKNPLVVDEEGRHWRESNYTSIINKAISEGHDSVIIKNTNDPINDSELVYDQYIVFDDSQIGVTKYFSVDSEYEQSILFQPAPPPDSQAFKDWFGDSKVVDENGDPKVVHHGTLAGDIEIFRTVSLNEPGVHFGTRAAATEIVKDNATEEMDDIEAAKHVGDYYLDIKNPIRLPDVFGGYKDLHDLIFFIRSEENKVSDMRIFSLIYDTENAKNVNKPEDFPWTPELDAYHDQVMKTVNADRERTEQMVIDTQIAAQNYLKSIGHDGVFYKNEGEDIGSMSYIAFSPAQIKSVNNQGTWDPENPNILYQQAIDDALEKAKEFDTWEEFKESYVMDAGFDFSIDLPDNDQWYIDVFNEANGVDTARADDTPTTRARMESENQKDQWFIEHLEDDENIEKFLKEIGLAITFKDNSYTPADAEEQADYERLQTLRETIPAEAHPIIVANAYRAASNKSITPRSMKSIRTMMTGRATRFYRDMYADVMQDEDIRPEVIDARLPKIDEPGYDELENFSISERLRLAEEIESAALKKKILSGKETLDGDAEKVIRTMDKQIQKLQERIEKAEQEIDESQEGMNDQEVRLSLLYKKLTDAQSALDRETKDLRRKAKVDPRYQADMSKSYSLNSQIDTLHDQIKKLRASDRVQATVKRHEALAKLKEELTDKQRKRDDARKIRAYKTQLSKQIMAKPSDAIDWEFAKRIYEMQAVIDPKFRQTSVNVEGENVRVDYLSDIIEGQNEKEIREAIGDMRYEELSDILGGSTEEDLRNALGDRVYERIIRDRKPLNDWTVSELEDIAEEIAVLREEGRSVLAAKDERKRAIADRYRKAIEQQLLTSGKYKPRPLYGSIDDKREREKFSQRFKSILYSTFRIEEKAMIIDGGMKGTAFDVLVSQRRDLQTQESRAIEKRMKPINDIMNREGKEITLQDLYGDIEITIDGQTSKVNRMYLAYAWLSQFNAQNRAAVAYGQLVKKDEKHIHFKEDNYLIQQVGDQRYQQLIDQARYHLFDMDKSGKYFDLIKAIRDDLNSQSERINEVSIREFNEQMRTLENYLPIHRQSVTGEEMEERIKDDLLNANAGGMATSVEQGFKQQRVNISPLHQSEVNMDLFGVWLQSMRDHEHFIHFAEYGRMLNRIFKNQNTTSTKDIITQSLGSAMRQDIEDYINEVINPQAFNRLQGSEQLFKKLRGNLGPAYLAWKTSGIVLQGITSPMPFFSDVHPLRLIKAYKDISRHPMETWDFITEKSPMMKNRSANIILEELKAKGDQYYRHWISRLNVKQQEIGTMGLTLIDRWSVMGGWMGAYQQKLAELNKQGIDSETADKQAVKFADDVVLRTQPTGDKLDMSPMFKNGSEAWKAVTQFQASLNVIWNNLVVDVPYMVKNAANKELPAEVRKREFARAIGQVTGYVLAGALLGAVAEGHDGNDDDREKLRNWLYWSTTQFTAAIPLFGDGIESIIEAQLKDESPYFFQDNFMPAIDNVLRGVSDIGQEEYTRALKNLSEGFGMYFGAPVSGTKEIWRIINEEGPEAALGRRDYK